ncbi:rod shape-determining protein MreC [Leminorella grimontii]|nr:rod shape-determining protein MreC [Leminorella grimontii]
MAVVSSVAIDDQRASTVIQAHPTVALQRLRYLLLLWPTDRDGNQPLPPEEVRRIAKERLRQMMPQVLPPESEPPTPPSNATPPSAVPSPTTAPAQPNRGAR